MTVRIGGSDGSLVERARNLFTNPAVASAAGFTSNPAQATRTYTGSAVRWTALTNSWTECRIDTPSAVTEGTSARLLVRARANRNLTARLRVRGAADSPITIGTAWAWYETTRTASSGSFTGIGMEPGYGHVADDWIEVDRVLIATGTYDGPWFSGDTPDTAWWDYSWVGIPNMTASIEKEFVPVVDVRPVLLDGYSATRVAGTVIHEIPQRPDPDVTVRPAGSRAGTLTAVFEDEAAADAALDGLGTADVFTLTSDERPSINMSFVIPDGESLALTLDPDTREAWLLEIPYREVST